jgi:hypothetical protein
MKTSSNVGRRTWLVALLGVPAAATGAAALVMRQRRSSGVLPKPTPKDESERRVLDVIADYDRTQRAGAA